MQQIYSIQILRAIAALLIAVGHLDNYAGIDNYTKGFSWVGIDLFFVISGFVIAYTIQPHLHTPRYAWRFTVKRLVRIYPTYWLICAIAAVVALWTGYRGSLEVEHYVKALVLFPQRIAEQFIPVAWSLHFELLFYAISALMLFCLGKHFWKGAVVWLIALIVAQFFFIYQPSPSYNWAMYFGSFYQFEFLCGLLVGYLLHQPAYITNGRTLLAIALMGACIAIGGLIWGIVSLEAKQKFGHYTIFIERCTVLGIGFGLLMFGLTQAERIGKIASFPRIWLRLGGASYVLYLLHDILYIVCGKLWELVLGMRPIEDPMIAYAVFMPITMVIVLISSVKLSECVEQPMIRFLKMRTRG
ncbi:MAG: acyltransferase [Rickettsiales bacterium]|nr:acyltransferase [Rickettsiales bacterium]